MRLAITLGLLLAPLTAHADPATIGAVFTWVAANWMAVAAVTVALGSAVYGSAQQKKMMRKAQRDHNNSLTDRFVSRIATDSFQRYVYGACRVGSTIVDLVTGGSKDQYKYMVCIHAAHEVEGISEIWLGSKPLGLLDANGYVTSGDYYRSTAVNKHYSITNTVHTLEFEPIGGTLSVFTIIDVTYVPVPFTKAGLTITLNPGDLEEQSPFGLYFVVSYKYAVNTSSVRVTKHLGTPDDPADAMLRAEVPDLYAATSVLRGYAYTVIRLDLNEPAFQGGPPSVEALIIGKKVWDPRDGVTRHSHNPALCILDYLLSPMCQIPLDDIPLAQYIAAANVCDQATWFGRRYTLDGTVTADQQQTKVLESMAQAMAGDIIGSTWEIRAGAYVAPVASLTQEDIVGDLHVSSGLADEDVFNTVRGKYVGFESRHVVTDFVQYQNATYLAADGKAKVMDLDFSFTETTQRIHNLCRIIIEDQRNAYTIRALFKMKAWTRKIGDRVYFTSAYLGASNKVFRITDKSYTVNGMVELTLKEDAASIWDFADAVTVDSTPNSALKNPFYLGPLNGITCSSGTGVLLVNSDGSITSRIKVEWPVYNERVVATSGLIEVQWKGARDAGWSSLTVPGDSLSAYISPVKDLEMYAVQIRGVDPALNVKSDWVSTTHVVIGKTEKPANVIGFSVVLENGQLVAKWTANSEPDIGGYELRLADSNWGTDDYVWRGKGTSTPLTVNSVGAKTFYIKARDTSGNYSTSAVASAITVSAPIAPSQISASFYDTSTTSAEATIKWNDGQSVFGVDYYQVVLFPPAGQGDPIVNKVTANEWRVPASWVGDATVSIKTFDKAGFESTEASFAITKSLPNKPDGFEITVSGSTLLVDWPDAVKTTLPVGGYEVRLADSNWGGAGFEWKGSASSFSAKAQALGVNTWYVKTFDTDGKYSATALAITYNALAASAPTSLSSSFVDTSNTIATVTLKWGDAVSAFGISHYIVQKGDEIFKVGGTNFTTPANWVGDKLFTVWAVDNAGFEGQQSLLTVTKAVPNAPTNFRSNVIDNNVLLYWDAPEKTTLPVVTYELRKGLASDAGLTWATAEVVGRKAGGFTSVFETRAGTYKYFLAAVDSDDQISLPTSHSASVAQPPDYILFAQLESTLSGTKNSAASDNESLLLPVNTTETFQQHFTSRAWTTPQDQVTAGYPVFIQPTATSGYYEETIDYGTVLAASKVTVSPDGYVASGSPVISCRISISQDGITYTDYDGQFSIYATNFRYVKIRITVTSSDQKSLYRLRGLNVHLDAKLVNDAGSLTANAADVGGTQVNFNIPFIDVISITVTPQGTTPVTAVYDFTDVPNPTGFKVLLFNSAGARVSGSVSWSVKGY